MNRTYDRDFIAPTREAIAEALDAAKIAVDPLSVDVLQRDDRLAATLPEGRMAWFPTGPAGRARLEREARVLRLLTDHCSFAVPTVEHVATEGWQLRRSVPGICDPAATYRRVREDSGFAAALGGQIGSMLASQHGAVVGTDLRNRLPSKPSWPLPRHQIEYDLRLVIDDATLIRRAVAIIERYESEPNILDPVLLHGDLGFHNMVVDPSTGILVGVFDYDDAAFGDRHHDFKYLLLDIPEEKLLHAAILAYQAARGAPIELARIHLFNAASAVGFLAYRAGHGAEERPAGRTLDEDLAWLRLAMARVETP